MTIYDLSRQYWDFCFENPDKIRPAHTAIYFFAIEHCNRLGWKEKFGLPASMVVDATGIKSYKTYKKHLDDLVEWGFIKMIEVSRNQYSSNIIALVKITKANAKALDKALVKRSGKKYQSTDQSTYQRTDQSTYQRTDSINKPIYNYTNIPYTNIQGVDGDLQSPPLPGIPDQKKVPSPNTRGAPDQDSKLYADAVEFWLKEFHPGWHFNGAQGKNLKELIKKVRKTLQDAEMDHGNAKVLETFKAMCIQLPEFFKEKELNVLNSKYNEIITEIKNKKNEYKRNGYTGGGGVSKYAAQ